MELKEKNQKQEEKLREAKNQFKTLKSPNQAHLEQIQKYS